MRTETGLGVLHLFCRPAAGVEREVAAAAVKDFEAADGQVVTAAMLGHKCDLAVMALHRDWSVLRSLQSGLQRAGLDVVDSYVSITEVSEYAKGMPEHMLQERLYPVLPPEGKPVFCFYPMTKRREAGANWYATPFAARQEMMYEHGRSGRRYAGQVVQLITGSTGLDDFEWGVTLFAVSPEVVKDVVYTMRFDKASALYGEFGRFYVGYLTELSAALAAAAH
jgi:hydrogen peroxide-dependent heme synthase